MSEHSSVILGISFAHGDSSAALIVDGCLLAAAEEERFTRIKHYAHFPVHAIQYCLKHAKLNPSEVKTVAVARKPLNALTRRAYLGLSHPQLWSSKYSPQKPDGTKKLSLGAELKALGIKKARIVRVEHHEAHMMSSRFLSDHNDTAFLSFDGLGDFVSTAIGRIGGTDVEIIERIYFPHSVGYFYTALTQFLGFPHYGDEFKVMGLSSYGKPVYLSAMRELIRETDTFGFQLNLEAFPILSHPMSFFIENAQPQILPFYNSNFLTHQFGVSARRPEDPLLRRHWDLARSVQARFEEIGNHLLGQLHDRVGGDSLALSGGCAHNSVWVGKIPKNSQYKTVHVAPASHDAGIAVGAAIAASKVTVTPEGQHWALLGPSLSDFSDQPIENKAGFDKKTFREEEELIDWMVEELNRGAIMGLFHGRLEFGPRALGSRSIIADPRVEEMKDKLNQRVKHREVFRPFAASVLWEYQSEWFEDSFFSPTMEAVFNVRERHRTRVPAVVHVDQTCRIQSVTRDTQPFFWDLIEAFRKRTGIPMLVNTSFNDSEPIVCSPQDAMRCFENTEMDHLVMGREVYSRKAVRMAKAS